jgi:LPXTG-motif cell wall-anchored protein
MDSPRNRKLQALAVVGGFTLAFAFYAAGQVQTETSTTSGTATKQVTVQTGTVELVSGNDLIVKLPDGTLRHFPNVPDSFRANVDGKELGIHDLKPGMVLTRTVVRTTTPETIRTVQTVQGKVWHVNPPSSVILTMEDGSNQQFKIPKGQKFNVNGEMVDAWGLRKGMTVTATKVVEEPQTSVSQTASITGTAPPPTPPPDQPILVAVITPVPAPAPAAESAPAPAATPAALPKTGSELPLIGLLGLLCLGLSFGVKLQRS